MKVRHVLLAACHYDDSGSCLAPVLRTAVGMACSYERPRVTVVLHGDAVRAARSCSNPDWTRRYLVSAQAHSIDIFVEKESLEARGLKSSDLVAGMKVVDAAELCEEWLLSDVQVRI